MTLFEKILKYSFLYTISQFFLAPGAHYFISRKIKLLISSLPHGVRLVDIGCGPKSWLWQAGLTPIGIDISYRYSETFLKRGKNAITGSAFKLPIKAGSIDGIWCIGVLHHLNDTEAQQAIDEMLRIVSSGGYIVIIDAVLPQNTWMRPVAAYIRRMDRGRFMRSQYQLESLLLSNDQTWNTERYTYAATGLEILQCFFINNAKHPLASKLT